MDQIKRARNVDEGAFGLLSGKFLRNAFLRVWVGWKVVGGPSAGSSFGSQMID